MRENAHFDARRGIVIPPRREFCIVWERTFRRALRLALGTHIFDAYLASLELIPCISNPEGLNQTLSIRICGRLILDADLPPPRLLLAISA